MSQKRSRKKETPAPPPVIPIGYVELLEELKGHIRQSQVKAALAVNRELISLYWSIGERIFRQQEEVGWGKNVIDRLAGDLQAEFPGVSGFSTRNIWRMRSFYLAWTKDIANLPQLVAELDGVNLPQPVAEIPWGPQRRSATERKRPPSTALVRQKDH